MMNITFRYLLFFQLVGSEQLIIYILQIHKFLMLLLKSLLQFNQLLNINFLFFLKLAIRFFQLNYNFRWLVFLLLFLISHIDNILRSFRDGYINFIIFFASFEGSGGAFKMSFRVVSV